MTRKKRKANKELPGNLEMYQLKGNVWQVIQSWYNAVVKKKLYRMVFLIRSIKS